MFDREAILPLAIGLCVAIFLHIATAAGAVVLRELQPGEAIGVEPASQRDLVAVELAVTEPRVAGRPVTITATVENVGMEPASPVSLLVHVDDEIVGRWQSPSALAPRQSTTRKFEYTAKTPGAKSVRLFVDPDDAVVESDELNNKQVETIVWLAPDVEAGARPDLAVVHLDVPAPRVAGRPSPVIIDVANLGGVAESPTEIVLARNGKPLGVIPLPEPPRPGQVARLVGDITVDEAGQHTLNATVDAMRKVDDRNRRNNTLARTFEWTRPRPELKVGQLEESPVSVNWISHEAFEDLLARKSEFDQATVQKTVDPVPVKQAPVDPTPPAPVTVAQKSQPTPPSPTPQKTSPSDTPRKTQPTERVAQPTQPVEFTEDQPKKIEQAPMLAKANPVAEAAAPKQDAPTPPSKIDKTSADADTPKPVTQPDANPRPEPAPKETATPAKELALVTPRVKPSKDGDPVLPKPVETPSEPTDEPKRVAPDVEPDPDAEAAQESAKQEGERMKRPEVAALTLPPVPTIEPGTPEKQPPKRDPDAVKSKVPDRPVVTDRRARQGRPRRPAIG